MLNKHGIQVLGKRPSSWKKYHMEEWFAHLDRGQKHLERLAREFKRRA